jgi:hypothetical protein
LGLTKEEAARKLLEKARELGRAPRAQELSPSVTRPLREQHGTYASALRHLGLEPALPSNQRWTRESIARELRRLHEEGASTTAHGLSKAGRHDILEPLRLRGDQSLGNWDSTTNSVGATGGQSVDNARFRTWRGIHHYGQDFEVYSDLKVLPLISRDSFDI